MRAAVALLLSAALALGAGACAPTLGSSGSDAGTVQGDGDASAPHPPEARGPDAGVSPDSAACPSPLLRAPDTDLPSDTPTRTTLPPCHLGAHKTAIASGQTLRIVLTDATGGGTITLTDARGAELGRATWAAGPPGPPDGSGTTVSVSTAASGALHLEIAPSQPDAPLTYVIAVRCEAGCDRESTRYPIVLVHGAGGSAFFGNGVYFAGIREALTDRGYRVFCPELPPWAHSADRAAALGAAVDGILQETGAQKVHLWAHSQGGLDLRVLLSPAGLAYGPLVATATSLATPHHGLRTTAPQPPGSSAMDVSEPYITGAFATDYPPDPTVLWFSWAGATCGALEAACLTAHDGEVVAPALAQSYLALRTLYATDGDGGDNDGVVPVSSARWGTFLGVLPADHWDQVGQIPGARLGPFDAPAFYLSEARRLRRLEWQENL